MTRQPAAVATEITAISLISTPKMSQGALSCASEPTFFDSGPNFSNAMFWSRNATANVATSITVGELVRSGRKTSRSMRTDNTNTTPKQSRIDSQVGRFQTAPYARAKPPAMISCP